MSTWLYIFALSAEPGQEESLMNLLTCSDRTHGVPDRLPEPRPLPTATAVLDAWRAAGLHSDPAYGIPELGEEHEVPLCPDPEACRADGGRHDLGEWSLLSAGPPELSMVRPDTPIRGCSFRHPNHPAVLLAACALAEAAGPHVVYDPVDGGVCVVWPGDQPEALAERWSWTENMPWSSPR